MSPRRLDLGPAPILVTFVVEEVAQVLWDFLVNIVPPMLHSHVISNITVIKKTRGKNLGTFQKNAIQFGCQGAMNKTVP